MAIRADRDTLVAAAAGWDGIGEELSNAVSELLVCLGRGYEFGWFGQRAGIDSQHDQFATAMVDALSDGSYRMKQIAEAIRATAKDFGATDTSVADSFHNPDGTPR